MTGEQCLPLDVAENVLLAEELATLLVDPPLLLEEADLKYPHNSIGDDDIRAAIAALWNETCHLSENYLLGGDQVVCTPGASAALYLHGAVRLKAGQSVIIPSPYWNNFDRIYKRLGIPLVRLPIAMDANSQVDLDDLAALHERLQRDAMPPGLLLLTNPHNPLGIVESRSQLAAILDWSLANTAMDVVVDEIYAHSLFGQTPFTSVMAMPQSLDHPERVHSVWGFAKDFGLSGWMTGMLLTRSPRLVKTISSGYARFSPWDTLKSRVFRRLLLERGEGRSPRQLMTLFGQRLRALHQGVTEKLEARQIPFREAAEGALFIWLDLRDWLAADFGPADLDAGNPPNLDIREHRLQRHIAKSAQVSLVRGQVLYADEPGFLRLCFTAAPAAAVLDGVDRLVACLEDLRP